MSAIQQKTPLRVLVIEDSEFDARILINTLKQGGYLPSFKRVDTEPDMRAALLKETWDVILSDYNMPGFSAPEALQIAQESGLDLPFIIISGGIGEDVAVAAMKAGANDYLMKGNLARLAPAVERELREATIRSARRRAEEALRESEQRYRLLWENSTDAVIVMNMEGVIKFANPVAEEIFGFTPSELVGRNFSTMLAQHQQTEFRAWSQRQLQAKEEPARQQPGETIGCRKDGGEIIIEIGFANIKLQGDDLLVAFIRDITARKRAEQELLANEEQFRVAREIQQRLFPKSAPQIAGFDIAGVSHAAEAAGGDYFDYLSMLHDRLGVVVGDVTGHGIGPALLMAETRAYLRILARNRDDVGEILTRANRVLAEDIGYERFITMVLVSFDPQTCALTYANAGHPAGYVLNAAGVVKSHIKRTGIPLGIKPDTTYPPGAKITLVPGDIVLLLTDGIDEAMSPEAAIFGIERALEVVRANQKRGAKEIVDALYSSVRRFSQHKPQLDDVTAVVVKVG